MLVNSSTTADSAIPVMVGSDAVFPVHSVRNLGIYIDFDISMKTNITKTTTTEAVSPYHGKFVVIGGLAVTRCIARFFETRLR